MQKKHKLMEPQFLGQIQQYYQTGKRQFQNKEFDLLNRKILYLLYENGRYSPTQLAKFLRTNRETILYRLDKMRKQEIITGFVALFNHEKLGLREYRVFFKLKTIGEEKPLMTLLLSLPTVVTINISTGSYDLVVAFWVKNEKEFLNDFQQVIDNFHQLITDYDVVVGLERDQLGMKYLLDEKEFATIPQIKLHKGSTFSKELERKQKADDSNADSSLDVIDKKILKKINLHADIALHQLAKQLSLSPFVLKKRMKSLILRNVIKKSFPIVTVSKLGYHWWYVLIKCTKLDHAKFLTYIQHHKNICWYIRLLGKWDYSISLFARDNAECHKVIAELRTTFAENILYYDVIVIFSQLKYAQRIE